MRQRTSLIGQARSTSLIDMINDLLGSSDQTTCCIGYPANVSAKVKHDLFVTHSYRTEVKALISPMHLVEVGRNPVHDRRWLRVESGVHVSCAAARQGWAMGIGVVVGAGAVWEGG